MPRAPDKHRAPGWKPREEQQREYNRERGSAASRGYDRAWTEVRRRKLALNPLCEVCAAQGRVTAATLAHHDQEVRARPDLRLDMANLISVCAPCHQHEHARRRA